jgi:translocator protein
MPVLKSLSLVRQIGCLLPRGFLYTLMGIAAYLVWSKGIGKKGIKTALIIFAIQLVLNSLWSVIFFGLRLPQYAFLEIIVLWVFILLTLWKFYQI